MAGDEFTRGPVKCVGPILPLAKVELGTLMTKTGWCCRRLVVCRVLACALLSDANSTTRRASPLHQHSCRYCVVCVVVINVRLRRREDGTPTPRMKRDVLFVNRQSRLLNERYSSKRRTKFTCPRLLPRSRPSPSPPPRLRGMVSVPGLPVQQTRCLKPRIDKLELLALWAHYTPSARTL
jgi:hypothetical protein